MISERPLVKNLENGNRLWEHSFNKFTAQVFVPVTALPEDVVNFGYSAPYILYLADSKLSETDIVSIANSKGLSPLASKYGTSIVFISPNSADWKIADESLFLEIISNSKIHQYYKDGYAILNNRFTNTCDGYAIRGAIYKLF